MKRKYFTEEEKKEARKNINTKWRRKKGIRVRRKFNSEEERQIFKKQRENEYNENHKEKRNLYAKEYRKTHKKEISLKAKKYKKTHKKEILIRQNKYQKKKLKKDINFKLAYNLRIRIYHALCNNQKSGSAIKDLGCSIPELKIYLENKFQPGMTWDNWSYTGWHIDHIKPLSSFDLTNREDFLKACHYTNLQPLWSKENWEKSNKTYNFLKH